jgi:hypothetical protein
MNREGGTLQMRVQAPLPFHRNFELLGNPAQFDKGVSLHLVHHLAAVHLCRDFARSECGGDLLGEHA